MAKKVTKKTTPKTRSRKAQPVRSKSELSKVSKSKVSKKSKATKDKSSRAGLAKLAKSLAEKSSQAKPAKTALASLSSGAGAKLTGKVGSAAPTSKAVLTRKVQHKVYPLTATELEEFRDLLLQRRRELLGSVSQMRSETLDKNRQDAAGNLSKFPTSPADLGSDNYELEFTLSLLESERDLLREIDEALERIDQGVYGICEGTGEPIPRTRLKFEPWTRYTVEYAGLLEKGLIRHKGAAEPEGWGDESQDETEEVSS